MEDRPFYSIAEVAEQLSLSQKSVRRYIASGQLGAVKIGSTYRIPISALNAFINQQKSQEQYVQYDLFGNIVEEKAPTKKNSPLTDSVNWFNLSKVWDNIPDSQMTFVDCFCGAGGLSKGLEMAGIHGVCGLDWFKEAGETYSRNFDHPFVNGDITLPEVKQKFYDIQNDDNYRVIFKTTSLRDQVNDIYYYYVVYKRNNG